VGSTVWLNEKPLAEWLKTHDGVFGVYKMDTSWWPSFDEHEFSSIINFLTTDNDYSKEDLDADMKIWNERGVPMSVLEGGDPEIGGQPEHWEVLWKQVPWQDNPVYFYISNASDDFNGGSITPDADGTVKIKLDYLGVKLDNDGLIYIPKGMFEMVKSYNSINHYDVAKIIGKQ
jgi:hypothetical protein